MDATSCTPIQEILLRRMKFAASASFSAPMIDSMELHVEERWWKELVLTLTMGVYTEELQSEIIVATVDYPATWWQHFKQSCFPKCLERRFPVRMTRVEKRVNVTKFVAYPQLPLVMSNTGPACVHYRVAQL